MPNKNIPMRRCVGCNCSKPKKELDRYVFSGESYEKDEQGRREGRGTYICKESPECLKKASKRKRAEFREAENDKEN